MVHKCTVIFLSLFQRCDSSQLFEEVWRTHFAQGVSCSRMHLNLAPLKRRHGKAQRSQELQKGSKDLRLNKSLHYADGHCDTGMQWGDLQKQTYYSSWMGDTACLGYAGSDASPALLLFKVGCTACSIAQQLMSFGKFKNHGSRTSICGRQMICLE